MVDISFSQVFRTALEDPTAEYLSVSSWDELNLPKDWNVFDVKV